MITTPTLFILGAGASKPYGYLTGAELRADIVKNFYTDFHKLSGIGSSNMSLDAEMANERVEYFVKNFDNSSLTSIDKYLAINPDDQYIGKIAITLSILKKERDSCFNEKTNDHKEDWYQYIYNRMTSDIKKPDDHEHFFENKVAFITFNYDRSLEYYLYNSFYHSFIQEEARIRNNMLVGNNFKKYVPFPIVHVYGTVDSLSLSDWYNTSHNYRRKFESFRIVETLSKGIKVIGEERVGESIKDEINKLLPDYKRIFFLGFGYAQDNLDSIDFPNSINNKWKIFGTAKGMTEREINEARSRINVNFPDHAKNYPYSNPRLKDVDSCALLRDHL
jgi:hypothetical protein